MKSISEIVNIIETDPAFIKHGRHEHWISGSSTVVYPISIWTKSKLIDIQWGRIDKRVINPFITRIIKESEGLIKQGFITKSDGSCPNKITFFYN